MTKDELLMLAKNAEQQTPFLNGMMFPPSRYYRFLYELASYKNAKLSVVLGVCGGGCCFNLIQAGGQVVGIDIADDYPQNKVFLKHFNNFMFIIGDSIDMASEVFNLFGKVDLLFIDTIHTYDRTIAEFTAWYEYMNDNCIVLLDDLYRDNMEDAWNYLIKNYGEGLRLDDLHHGGSPSDGGFGVIYNIR